VSTIEQVMAAVLAREGRPFTTKEIASDLGITTSAVRNCIYRLQEAGRFPEGVWLARTIRPAGATPGRFFAVEHDGEQARLVERAMR